MYGSIENRHFHNYLTIVSESNVHIIVCKVWIDMCLIVNLIKMYSSVTRRIALLLLMWLIWYSARNLTTTIQSL